MRDQCPVVHKPRIFVGGGKRDFRIRLNNHRRGRGHAILSLAASDRRQGRTFRGRKRRQPRAWVPQSPARSCRRHSRPAARRAGVLPALPRQLRPSPENHPAPYRSKFRGVPASSMPSGRNRELSSCHTSSALVAVIPVSSFAPENANGKLRVRLLPAAPVAPECFRFSSVGKVAAAIGVFGASEQTSPCQLKDQVAPRPNPKGRCTRPDSGSRKPGTHPGSDRRTPPVPWEP